MEQALVGLPASDVDLGCRVAALEAKVADLERKLAETEKVALSLRKQAGVFWGKFSQIEGKRGKKGA